MKIIAFIFSGRGTLLHYIQDQLKILHLKGFVSLVITNNPSAAKESLPIRSGCEFHYIDHKSYENREDHENAIIHLIDRLQIDLIVLGGYRRIFTSDFVDKYGYKTINTHPSLLPAFVGDKAQLMAIQRGVRITGATVHFINNDVDCGPIITQVAVNIHPSYSEKDLKEAIIQQEKKALMLAIRLFIEDKLIINGNLVRIISNNNSDLFVNF